MKSRSKSLVRIALTAALLTIASQAAYAQDSSRIPVTVRVAANPGVQLENCHRARAAVYEVDGSARLQRVLEVLANLDVIRRAFPKATEAIAEAAVLQYEIALEFNMPRNAVDALTGALPFAANTPHEARLRYRLGDAHDVAGQFEEAEREFLAAERSASFKRLARIEANDALRKMANHYVRRNKPRDAMNRFRAAADLPNQSPLVVVGLRMSALNASVALKDDAAKGEAKREAKAVRDAIRLARANGNAAQKLSEAPTLDTIEQDLVRLSEEFGL
jgi:tetratricopeptide (TPR) repeat protein